MNNSLISIEDTFAAIQGNDRIKAYLKRMVSSGRIANSLLFAGPRSACKEQFAYALAQMVLEGGLDQHPDLHIYRPEGKLGLHSIESLREFGNEVYMPPYKSGRKVFLIEEAHRMWPVSANSLLKTFEEPPTDTIIVLLTHSPQSLLSTILSRCRAVYFEPVDGEKEEVVESLSYPFLNKPRRSSYKEFLDEIKALSQHFENKKKEVEAVAKEQLGQRMGNDPTAAQKQALEKQVEGEVSTVLQGELGRFFEDILTWYRDLHLLKVNGNSAYLYHPYAVPAMEQAMQRGEVPSLEKVHEVISDAQLSLERSTTISHVLERLFLSLDLYQASTL